jgi:hypothetical protein
MAFKFELDFQIENISVDTEIKISKLKAMDLQKAIITKSAEGKAVKLRTSINGEIAEGFNRVYVDENNAEIQKGELRYFINTENGEMEVKPYDRTKKIEVSGVVPIQNKEQFLIESFYEVYGDNKKALLKMAKWLGENNQMAMAKFTFGNGFKEFIALIYPIFQDDNKFVLVMALSRATIQYNNFMEVVDLKEAEKSAIPTLSQIQMPILIPNKKKVIK